MTHKHDNDKRPHGETGNTVEQAAEVSRPTSDLGRALHGSVKRQVQSDSTTGAGTREGAGGGLTGAPDGSATGIDPRPGRSDSR